MRVSPVVSASLAAVVVIVWFLWPVEAALKDPVASAFAAGRAIALFAVTLGATNAVAAYLPSPQSLIGRSGIGFGIALTIVLGVSFGLTLTPMPQEAPMAWRPLMVSAATDALSCALALALYYALTRRALSTRL